MSIELKNVTKQFGEVPAVHNVSFSVREGELMALLGPSGGGKTTVLRMIAGLEMPTAGDVYIRGRRVNDVPVQQRNIGFVFQNYALFKHMSVAKNIAFGLKIKGWKRADAGSRVAELVKLFGLEDLESRYPHQLSGGQRQRVAIARALAPKPSVLLLDEPSMGLAPLMVKEVFTEILRLKDVGVTVLIVEQNAVATLQVADRAYVIETGEIILEGLAADLMRHPEVKRAYLGKGYKEVWE